MASRYWDGGSLVMNSDGTHDLNIGGCSNIVRKEVEEDTYRGKTDFCVHSESLDRRRSHAPSGEKNELVALTEGVFGCKWDAEGMERELFCYFALWTPFTIHSFECNISLRCVLGLKTTRPFLVQTSERVMPKLSSCCGVEGRHAQEREEIFQHKSHRRRWS